MKAELLVRRRISFSERAFAEIVVWRVPARVKGSGHSYKYRLAYVEDGECVIRCDNEAGKGDHLHRGGVEQQYDFHDIGRLMSDFRRDVEKHRNENAQDQD